VREPADQFVDFLIYAVGAEGWHFYLDRLFPDLRRLDRMRTSLCQRASLCQSGSGGKRILGRQLWFSLAFSSRARSLYLFGVLSGVV
jgi:hypothetical protein